MGTKRIYFDNAASTPVDKRVYRKMRPYFMKYYGNPSSSHQDGKRAYSAIELARSRVAKALDCNSDEIFFTSGSSESISWVSKLRKIIVYRTSHHSMVESKKDCNPKLSEEPIICVPLIDGETGTEFEDFKKNQHYFLDLTAAIGKIPISLNNMKMVDYACGSGHKFGSPKGIGFLYIRSSYQKDVLPLIYGSQENSFRGGTENVPGIVGMGLAIEIATKELSKNKKNINEIVRYLNQEISKRLYVESMNNIVNITFQTLNASSAVLLFDIEGVSVSAGSACNSKDDMPSEVLMANGYSPDEALRTIRVSLGVQNTMYEAQKFVEILNKIIDKYDI